MKELVSWPGLMSMAALAAVLVTSTVVLLLRRLRGPAASLVDVIHDIDQEPAPRP